MPEIRPFLRHDRKFVAMLDGREDGCIEVDGDLTRHGSMLRNHGWADNDAVGDRVVRLWGVARRDDERGAQRHVALCADPPQRSPDLARRARCRLPAPGVGGAAEQWRRTGGWCDHASRRRRCRSAGRELVQAGNLLAAWHQVGESPLLVWCGNAHHAKLNIQDWTPMGVCFLQLAGIEHFSIDQTQTISFTPGDRLNLELTYELSTTLESLGGTAGFVAGDEPSGLRVPDYVNALSLSTDNEMTG